MLHSTVTTGSYILEKYSRSYPPSAFAQTQSQSLPTSQPEWQHFTNPIITLTLDAKKSMDNKFESVRLRILWDMNAGHNGAQREIVMEDLDLLSFSGLDSQVHSTQGPPLKAVYRGTAVGIRYQYPLTVPATSPASYRRFQVNFVSAGDAVQFINAIRPVCPCKENTNGPPPTPQNPENKPSVPTSASIQPPSARASLIRHHTMAPQRPSMPPPSSAGAAGSSQEEPPSSQRMPAPFLPPPSSPELSLPPTSSSDLAAAPPHPISGLCPLSLRTSPALPEMHSSQFTVAEQSRGFGSMSSLPTLSQPTSSAATLAPPPPSLSHWSEEGKIREAFLESLREAPELYNLARPELENLVSVVVREPGFPRLLEALDSMWVIRGFLGR